MENKMTLKNAAKEAIFVQSACNLSGVVKSFSRVMDCLWDEARKQGKATEFVNTHPIARLFLEQIAYLNGCLMVQDSEESSYSKAYAECERLSQEPELEAVTA